MLRVSDSNNFQTFDEISPATSHPPPRLCIPSLTTTMSIAEPRKPPLARPPSGSGIHTVRQHSETYSDLARQVIMANASAPTTPTQPERPTTVPPDYERVYGTSKLPALADSQHEYHASLMPPPTSGFGRAANGAKPLPASSRAMGQALTDTPMPSQPGSPQM